MSIAFTEREPQLWRMPKLNHDRRSAAAIAWRLQVTQRAFCIKTQTEFAARADIETNAYNQFFVGKRPLTLIPALKICEEFGVTLDWLFRGDLAGTPDNIATALRRAMKHTPVLERE